MHPATAAARVMRVARSSALTFVALVTIAAAPLISAIASAQAMAVTGTAAPSCSDRVAPREVRLLVDELPTVLHRLGLHEDFLELRASARLSAAGLVARPPLANGCRHLEIAVQSATDGAPTRAVVRVRVVEGSAVAGREFAETVALTGDSQLDARRADIERVLAAVGRQVDAYVRSADGAELAAVK